MATTIYWEDGTQQTVPDSDVEYWTSQGWSTSDPTASSDTTEDTTQEEEDNLLSYTDVNEVYKKYFGHYPIIDSATMEEWRKMDEDELGQTIKQKRKEEIDKLYQKYLGRDAKEAEVDSWSTRSDSELEDQLLKEYRDTVNHGYDGTPIQPGEEQTEKDLRKEDVTLYKGSESFSGPLTPEEVEDMKNKGWSTEEPAYDVHYPYMEKILHEKEWERIRPYVSEDDIERRDGTIYLNTAKNDTAYNVLQNYRNSSEYEENVSGTGTTTEETQDKEPSGDATGEGQEFYEIDGDLYNAQTGEWISPSEWEENWEGQATEVEPPQDSGDTTVEGEKTEEGQTTEDTREEYQQVLDEALENGKITPEEHELFENVVGNVPPDSYDVNEVLNSFEKVKEDTIDPYFSELADVAKKNFQKAYEQLESSREREVEELRREAGENVRQAKESTEKAGMTFTGQAIEKLGDKSAYAQEEGEDTALPTQDAFAGKYYEGRVNQQNRLRASRARDEYQQSIQELGREAESTLGKEEASGLGIPYESSGQTETTAELPQKEQEAKASALNQIINQYRKNLEGSENTEFDFNLNL